MKDPFLDSLLYYLITTPLKFVVLILLFVLPLAALLTWMERRQSALSQDRLGPCRASLGSFSGKPLTFGGLLHVVADALKMFFKEPFTPQSSDIWVFRLAPAVGFSTALLVMCLIPFGPTIQTSWPGIWSQIPLQIVPLEHGMLWLLAISSLGVYGAALAGWSSNNRFALLGGLRASAQSISYEVALGLSLVGLFLLAGSCDLAVLVDLQSKTFFGGLLPAWGIFLQPLAALIFLAAAMAETKRAPFDLPEGESEIIGYFVEYSSMGFGMFMLGEFVEVVVLASTFTTLFLGGWQLPWFLGRETVAFGPWVVSINAWLYGLLGMLIFSFKVFMMCVLQLQIRWTLPRFRYDQLMRLGWKMLLPWSLINIVITTLWVLWDPHLHQLPYAGLGFWALVFLIASLGPQASSSSSATGVSHGH